MHDTLKLASVDLATEMTRRGVAVAADGALRLHLGCGEQKLAGYVNIDYPGDAHNVMAPRPDVEVDIATLRAAPGSVDEIRSHHVFEHFNRVAALAMLIRWRDWLKPAGLVVIETPDFMASARAALEAPGRDAIALLRHIEGDQAAAWGYHVVQWYPARFERTLSALGYVDLAFEETDTAAYHRPALFNVTVRARKGGEMSRAALLQAADDLLWEAAVSDLERPTWEVWRAQLRAWLSA